MIVNGRKIGDSTGKKTCFTSTGSSLPDYFLSSIESFDKVLNIEIGEKPWYSDHCPLILSLKIGENLNGNIPKAKININDQNMTKVQKYVWNNTSKDKFIHCAGSKLNIQRWSTYTNTNFTDADSATEKFTKIINDIAKESLILKDVSQTNHGNKERMHEKDTTNLPAEERKKLREHKREFAKARRQLEEKEDHDRRHRYIVAQRRYRKLKYYLFNKQKENRLNELARLERVDPKAFWKGVKNLTGKKLEEHPSIGPQTWVEYFQALLNIKTDKSEGFLQYVKHGLPHIEREAISNEEINQEISLTEVVKTLRQTKNGKSTGPDKISNEMIKHGGVALHKALTHLYNIILRNGKYPEQWKISVISPIHKNSDRHDPNNYRGVAVPDCTSKVFCRILNDRIKQYLDKQGFWKINQNGFLPERQTVDNIMVLHTIFQK